MIEKVTSLYGGPVNAGNEPLPDLISFLERLLARARSGEMRAIAVAYVKGNGLPSEGWEHGGADPSHVFALHSGITCLLGNFTDRLNASDSVVEVKPPPEENG